MDFLIEKIAAVCIAVLGPLLTIFDLPGNTLLLLTGLALAFWDEGMYFQGSLLPAMILVYALGEAWEFCVGLFGIKRRHVSWFAVFVIGVGGFVGTLLGTAVLPVLGSVLGGLVGAFAAAYFYELRRTGLSAQARQLAWEAAKMRFLALIGKLAAGIVLAGLVLRQAGIL